MNSLKIKSTLRYSAYFVECEAPLQEEDFIPEKNEDYNKLEYWDYRFAREEVYDWLGTYQDSEQALHKVGLPFHELNLQVLVVGCGNSTFSLDLVAACPSWKVLSTDYSSVLIDRLKTKYPSLQWSVQDMTSLASLEDNSFDLVIEKAAMDALVTDAGSPWEPNQASCDQVDAMVASCGRVLKPGGRFIAISFQPTLFRLSHLRRGMVNSEKLGVTWQPEIQTEPAVNQSKGTEFTVFAMTRT